MPKRWITLLIAIGIVASPLIFVSLYPEWVAGFWRKTSDVEVRDASEKFKRGILTKTAQAFEGYTLLSLLHSDRTVLVDMDGQLVHEWRTGKDRAIMSYLLEDGSLIRTGRDTTTDAFRSESHPRGVTSAIVKYDWDGKVVWEYRVQTPFFPHHDIEPLPNGNLLLMVWDIKSREEAIQAGMGERALKEEQFYSESILEIEPQGTQGGKVVWEWHMWDHLVQNHDETKDNFGDPRQAPRRIDLNYQDPIIKRDFRELVHMNSVDYHPELDQIVLSAKLYGEVWVIDHSTTTEEAASQSGGRHGHGGDLLYRCGNPHAYLGDDAEAERQFFYQHDALWIPPGYPGNGHFTIYNNGSADLPQHTYSTAEEFQLPISDDGSYSLAEEPLRFSKAKQVWEFQPRESSYKTSGAQRLPNGNTLICSGDPGYLVEVDSQGKIVWEFRNHHGTKLISGDGKKMQQLQNRDSIFRALRYPADFPAFQGRDLTPIVE